MQSHYTAIISITLFSFLSACAYNYSATPSTTELSPKHSGNALDFSKDPDGDNDAKGYLYFPANRPATGRTVFIFDPNYSAWALYDKNGQRLNTGRASGGKAYCPDVGRPCRTVSGNFRIYSKGDFDCESSKYPLETNGGAPMPYCMHFNKGYAVHGSYDVPDYNASHGCIRITPAAAQWLNTNNYISIGSSVIVLPYNS